MDILNPVGGPVLRIKKIDNKKGLYFVRIRNHHFFDVDKEIELAKKMAKSLSIISYSVKVETDLENGKFVFDFKNILEHLRHALPNLNMVSGQLATEAMLAYNHFSGKTIPFGIYRDGDIQVSLIFGEEMATRRFLDDCPFSEKEPCEKEPKDNWKLDYAKSIITGQFTPAAEESAYPTRTLRRLIAMWESRVYLPIGLTNARKNARMETKGVGKILPKSVNRQANCQTMINAMIPRKPYSKDSLVLFVRRSFVIYLLPPFTNFFSK
ncbi:MAG: hypothetical protein EOM15_13465 [Spirochaetia bacterium]|nr:hypothetical protein [Spirochaetia bacterium]